MASCRHALIAVGVALSLWIPSALGVVSFSFTHEFSGDTAPQGTYPWVTVQFSDGPQAGTVAIRIDTTNLIGEEYVSELYLNLKPQFSVADLRLSITGKNGLFDSPAILRGENAYKADGDGRYDIWLDFATNNPNSPEERFGVGVVETLFILATGPDGLPLPGLTPNAFYAFSQPEGGHGPFLGAAHIQAIGDNADLGGWIAVGDDDGGPIEFPEPATLSLLAAGGCILLRRRT
jgi:hypothetical protein